MVSGGYHSCALNGYVGGVRCWGKGFEGQLGNGSNDDSNTVPVSVKGPLGIGSLSHIHEITLGDLYTCALDIYGYVFCWGEGSDGQLGTGNNNNQNTPQQVKGVGGQGNLSGIQQISAGERHTCAVKEDGRAYCWGLSANDRFSNSNSLLQQNTPIQVTTLSDIIQVSTGQKHTCALRDNGEVRCWGEGSKGQLGDTRTTDSSRPLTVRQGNDVIDQVQQISSGDNHTCAVKTNETAVCWGSGLEGSIGNGSLSNANRAVEVVDVDGSSDALLSQIVHISAGGDHTCAVKEDGKAFCWGKGSGGRLGYGGTTSSPTPKAIGSVEVRDKMKSGFLVNRISTGLDHTCALKSNGTVSCWGQQSSGRLGNNITRQGSVFKDVPIQVVGVDGTGTFDSVLQLSLGGRHSCALRGENVFCWGHGGKGQLGYTALKSEASNTGSPLQVVGTDFLSDSDAKLTDIVQVSGAGDHNCAVKSNGKVVCWGEGALGRLGTTSTTLRSYPWYVSDVDTRNSTTDYLHLEGVTQMSSGLKHNCAVRVDGGVVCWGSGAKGQLGTGSVSNAFSPRDVQVGDPAENLKGIVQVSAGEAHTCALNYQGQIYCWGDGADNRLTGSNDGSSHLAILAENDDSPIIDLEAVVAGDKHTCVLGIDKQVYCWGSGDSGSLGHSEDLGSSDPVSVSSVGGNGSLKDIEQISTFKNHTCALKTNGTIACWGAGESGQLGNDRLSNKNTPVHVLRSNGSSTSFDLDN